MDRAVWLLLVCLIPGPVGAVELGASLASYHFRQREEVSQEANMGVYVRYAHGFATVFRNSYGDATVAAGAYFRRQLSRRVSVGLGVGMSYGYGLNTDQWALGDADIYGAALLPFIFPTVSYHAGGRWAVNTHVMPDALAWSVSYQFKRRNP